MSHSDRKVPQTKMHSSAVTADPLYPQAELWQQPSWPLQPSKSPKFPGGWGPGPSGASSASAVHGSLGQGCPRSGSKTRCWGLTRGVGCDREVSHASVQAGPRAQQGAQVRAAVTMAVPAALGLGPQARTLPGIHVPSWCGDPGAEGLELTMEEAELGQASSPEHWRF